MTVMFPPLVRLGKTRVVLAAQIRRDMDAWQAWVTDKIKDGAGMIVASDPGFGDETMAEALSRGRMGASRALIGAAEPLNSAQLADVIHIETLDHASLWTNRVVGYQVNSDAEVDASLASGLGYIVVDGGNSALLDTVIRKTANTNMLWFVSGLESMDDLEQGVKRGVRRVWLDDGFDRTAVWAAYLRQVWSEDPIMKETMMARMRRRIL